MVWVTGGGVAQSGSLPDWLAVLCLLLTYGKLDVRDGASDIVRMLQPVPVRVCANKICRKLGCCFESLEKYLCFKKW